MGSHNFISEKNLNFALIYMLLTETKKNVVTELPLMEAFYTLQGDGAHSGKAAYFIRLAGCNVGCVWCDVKESWDATAHPKVEIENIVENALKFPGRIAVVTGGEPLMHPLGPLCDELIAHGFSTHIETSGAYPLSGKWNWICLSPKKFKAPLQGIHEMANELKVVVYNKSDLDWAEEHARMVSPGCQLYLQPEWSRAEAMMPLITEYVKAHPRWRVGLQMHKYLGIP
jgi:7-carboxy-7-deazaguanine synthase